MRIGYLYDFRAFPPRGGNHVHALQLIRGFLSEGHEVYTFGDDSVPGVSAIGRNRFAKNRFDESVDVLYVRIDSNQVRRDRELCQLLRSSRLPMVWEINAPANESLAFSWLGGSRGSPQSAIGRALDTARRAVHAGVKIPGIVAEETLRRSLARRVHSALCVSDALCRYASEGLGIERVYQMPNGADHKAVLPTGPEAELPWDRRDFLTVIYVGSPMYPWQGINVLLETIKLCAEANDPLRFVLLVNQPLLQFPVLNNMVVRIAVPHSEVGTWIRAADVGVSIHPEYTWSRWGFHGSPMKMFDYMACARPVVASAIGQMKQIIDPGVNGYLFDNSPEDLRKVLLDLWENRAQVRTVGERARGEVELRYNWEQIAANTSAKLRAAIASRG